MYRHFTPTYSSLRNQTSYHSPRPLIDIKLTYLSSFIFEMVHHSPPHSGGRVLDQRPAQADESRLPFAAYQSSILGISIERNPHPLGVVVILTAIDTNLYLHWGHHRPAADLTSLHCSYGQRSSLFPTLTYIFFIERISR